MEDILELGVFRSLLISFKVATVICGEELHKRNGIVEQHAAYDEV